MLLLVPSVGSAMTVLAADLPDLCRDSAAIVRVTVHSVENIVLDKDGKTVDQRTLSSLPQDRPPVGMRAFTDVTFQVEQRYKGSLAEQTLFTIRQVGGTMGPFTLAVPGTPGFVPNTEVVLFLEKNGDAYIPLGAGQGVFRVERPKNGAVTVNHDLQGMAVVRPGPKGALQGVSIPKRMPLEALETQIRAFLGQSTPADLKAPTPRRVQSP